MLQISWRGDNCWNCKTTKQKFRCKGCGFALYCSKICQKEHWKSLHVSHCKYLAGKKTAPGSVHTQDSCESCKKQCVDYKDLVKKDLPGLACHIKMMVYKGDRQSMAKYNWNYKNADKDTTTIDIVNMPFEFGEITGSYLDYMDKLLGTLSCLICILVLRYPTHEKIKDLSGIIVNFRAYHWLVSMQTRVTSERIALTLKYTQNMYSAAWLLDLHPILGKLESQHGVTAWHSFLFLYEMLGIWAFIHPLVCMDIDAFEKDDIHAVRDPQIFCRMIRKTYVRDQKQFIKGFPVLSLVSLIETNFETLCIWDEDFNLIPFQFIYEQFSSKPLQVNPKLQGFGFQSEYNLENLRSGCSASSFKGNQNPHAYTCEICFQDVDPKESLYVFHNLSNFESHPSVEAIGTESAKEKRRIFDESQIKEGIAFTTYTMGTGMETICNKDDCSEAYESEVSNCRARSLLLSSLTMTKYMARWADLQCWVCKLFSGKSHRCSICKSRLYCSPECQNKDWDLHKTICKDLKEAETQVKHDSQERKHCGDLRADDAFEIAKKGCSCVDVHGKNCLLHKIRKLYGKMELELSTAEDEVD